MNKLPKDVVEKIVDFTRGVAFKDLKRGQKYKFRKEDALGFGEDTALWYFDDDVTKFAVTGPVVNNKVPVITNTGEHIVLEAQEFLPNALFAPVKLGKSRRQRIAKKKLTRRSKSSRRSRRS